MFGPLVHIAVPSSAFSNGQGSYTIPQLPFTEGTNFLLIMLDATSTVSGFGSGQVTAPLTVGAPVANNSCNTSSPALDFYFELPSQLKQCR